MNHRARAAALKRLDAFVGEWQVDASFPGSLPGRSVFEWALDRQYLIQRSMAPHPAPRSLAVVSVDPKTGAYTQHYFDSRGVTRVYAMLLGRGTWILTRESPDFSPLDFNQRFIGKFSRDGSTIKGSWETSRKRGEPWAKDFDLTFSRVGPERRGPVQAS
ncbi:MAG TPA: hypothetical protein VNU19_06370 [Candidatus Acidoferrum sp.]|jgi:hypothetical protein|nr:hypothetical protein [Candidatus Acidoferrum sp.]